MITLPNSVLARFSASRPNVSKNGPVSAGYLAWTKITVRAAGLSLSILTSIRLAALAICSGKLIFCQLAFVDKSSTAAASTKTFNTPPFSVAEPVLTRTISNVASVAVSSRPGTATPAPALIGTPPNVASILGTRANSASRCFCSISRIANCRFMASFIERVALTEV